MPQEIYTAPQTPEVGQFDTAPERREELQSQQVRTADSINNTTRMLAKKADAIHSYGTLAPLAPEGYSQIGSQSTSELYVAETGIEPGEKPVPTKIKLNGTNHLRATVTTESGVAEGAIESKHTAEVEHVLDEQDVRDIAATALWEKRRELREQEDRLRAAASSAGQAIIGSVVTKQ